MTHAANGNGNGTAGGSAGLPILRFGGERTFPFPDLAQLQTGSYQEFLQEELPSEHRSASGLEAILREVFPISSYDKTMWLEYLGYELGSPRYTPDECRELQAHLRAAPSRSACAWRRTSPSRRRSTSARSRS